MMLAVSIPYIHISCRLAVNVIEPLIELLLDVKEIRREFKYCQRLIQVSLAVDKLVESADKVAIFPLLIDRLVPVDLFALGYAVAL